jgi:hypothetical protein
VDYDNHAFLVVGRLGVHADSGLANDILLQGPGLSDVEGPYFVDIDGGVKTLERIGSARAESIAGRTDQRTNIDYVSPLVIACGWGLTLLGSGASGLLIAGFCRPVATLRIRLGLRRIRVLVIGLFPLMLCVGAIFVTVWFLALTLAGALRSAPEFAAAAGIPLALGVIVSVGALSAALWGKDR